MCDETAVGTDRLPRQLCSCPARHAASSIFAGRSHPVLPLRRVAYVIAPLPSLSFQQTGRRKKKDPHNKFCGEDECYSVLGLERGADKSEIKKAYRAISLDVHPDKNPTAEAKEQFTVGRCCVVRG